MFPILVSIPFLGGIHIYTYGVLVALAFLSGILWTTHEAKKVGISSEFVLDLSFYIILAALAGSRVLYVIIDWERYALQPLSVFKIWEGGLVFYGGFIGAVAVSFFYIRKHGKKFLQVADIYVPGIALGHAIGRLGCLMSGCCYGREATHFPFAIHFPNNPYSLAPAGVPLYPSQAFESITALIIFSLLVLFRRKKHFDGQIFLLYIALYGLARSVLETFRGDSIRGFVIEGWISTSQAISLTLMTGALILYLWLRSHNKTRRSS